MERTICAVPLYNCTIMKMEISISYQVIVNSQLNRHNLTRCYIIHDIGAQSRFVMNRKLSNPEGLWQLYNPFVNLNPSATSKVKAFQTEFE